MSAQDDELISSLYPPPPTFYQFFTRENLEAFEGWKADNKKSEQSDLSKENEKNKEDKEKESLPPGVLKFLVPPEPVKGSHYRGFGNFWPFEDELPNLTELGWKQLYPEEDESITYKTKIKELHKLMDSLLLNYLEFIGIMSIDPHLSPRKIEDLKLILMNVNHILNTYRPHQSRENLLQLLKKQINTKRKEISEIDNVCATVKKKIKELGTTDTDIHESHDNVRSEMQNCDIVDLSEKILETICNSSN